MTAITRTANHQYAYAGKGPFPGCTAIAGLQDAVGGSDGLMGWGVNIALDEYRRVLAETKDWDRARTAAWDAKDEPRNLGSAVHVALDHFNRGLPLELTDKTAPYVAQYAAWLRNRNIEIVGSERFVMNATVGFGGTYDALARIDGALYLMDWKTGKAKASQRLQLAGLSMAELHGEPGEEPEPMPKVDGAYIALIRPDGPPELIPHEITDEDREHFKYLVGTYHRIKQWVGEYVSLRPQEEKAA